MRTRARARAISTKDWKDYECHCTRSKRPKQKSAPEKSPPCLCVLAPSRTLGQQYCPTILIVREDGGDRKKGSSGVNKRGGRGFVLSNWCFPKVLLLVQSGRVGRRCTPQGGGGGNLVKDALTGPGVRRRCETGREPQVKVVR